MRKITINYLPETAFKCSKASCC